MGQTRIFQLLNGIDLIGSVVSRTETSVRIKEPQVIVMQPRGEGKMEAKFMPYFPFTKERTMTIQNTAIVIEEEPLVELSNAYNTQFGSGIVIAPAGAVPLTDSDGRGGLQGSPRIL